MKHVARKKLFSRFALVLLLLGVLFVITRPQEAVADACTDACLRHYNVCVGLCNGNQTCITQKCEIFYETCLCQCGAGTC